MKSFEELTSAHRPRSLTEFDPAWLDWYRSRYSRSERKDGFIMGLSWLLRNSDPRSRTIVETGCQRQDDDIGAGESTRIFSSFCSAHGGRLITLEIDPNKVQIAQECCQKHWRNVVPIVGDSTQSLADMDFQVDLLYLDSMDYLDELRTESQEHCLRELRAAVPILRSSACLMIDDNDLPGGGKSKLVKEELRKDPSWWTALDSKQLISFRLFQDEADAQEPSRKVFVFSSHAALERSMSLQLSQAGFGVVGVFDVGSNQRPKVPGITDRRAVDHRPTSRLNFDRSYLMGADSAVVMDRWDLVPLTRRLLVLGVPTTVYLHGQASPETVLQLGSLSARGLPLTIASAFKRELKILEPVDDGGILIRFGIEPTDEVWTGSIPKVLAGSNSWKERGDSCSWDLSMEILGGIPTTVHGNRTELYGGCGEVTYSCLRGMRSTHAVAFSPGTKPSPYTLSPCETMSMGCPTAILDNGSGIEGEGCFEAECGMVSSDPQCIRDYLVKVLFERSFAEDQSKACNEMASRMWSWKKAVDSWRHVLDA